MQGWNFTGITEFQGKPPCVALAIFHIDKVPPHIMLLGSGLFYSLEVKGPRLYPANELLSKVHRKKIPVVLVELAVEFSEEQLQYAKEIFLNSIALSPGQSCIDPIITVLERVSSLRPSQPLIFGLLQTVQSAGLIRGYQYFNLSHLIKSNSYFMPAYTATAISSRIGELNSGK